MREIKFRAWDNLNNKFLWIGFKDFTGSTHEDKPVEERIGHLTLNASDQIEWQQYTGLKDKNGVEIYEGDILSVCNGSINGMGWMEKPYVVKYKVYGWDICGFCWSKDGSNNMDSTHWCEVIGNVHQNPELLNP